MNAITRRSEKKKLEGPKMSMSEVKREAKEEGSAKVEVSIETPSAWVEVKKTWEAQAESISPLEKPYKPLVPYSQRLVKATDEHKYEKFLEMLKKFHINIPFLEAITNVSSYAKFLKDFLSHKREVT